MKKTICLLLAIFFFCLIIDTSFLSVDSSSDLEDCHLSKIHFSAPAYGDVIIDSEDSLLFRLEELKGFVTYSSESNDELILSIEFNYSISDSIDYLNIISKKDRIESHEERLSFRKELNDFSKAYHQGKTAYYLEQLDPFTFNSQCIVNYSPFVVYSMDPENVSLELLEYLSSCEFIYTVFLSLEPVTVDSASWTKTLEIDGAYDIVSSGDYDGSFFRVGIYESGGVCDVNHTNLEDVDITIHDPTSDVTDHATAVTSVLALIVPNASYYVRTISNNGFSWFLDNYCDVVNCSFHYNFAIENGDNTYSPGIPSYGSFERTLDYQIRHHLVSVFASAGNYNNDNTSPGYNPNGVVGSPGIVYNVITVGGVNRSYSSGHYVINHEPGACYVSSTPYVKPEISAVYSVNIPNIGVNHGTSFAAPQAAACAVIMMDIERPYWLDPVYVKSALMTAADKTDDYVADRGNFSNKVGAGHINLDRVFSIDTYQYYTNYLDHTYNSGVTVIDKNIYLTANSELQTSLAYYSFVLSNDSNYNYVTDYDIRIYNSSNVLVASSSLNNTSNVELVRYLAPSSGSYRVTVYRYSTVYSLNDRDYIMLTITSH